MIRVPTTTMEHIANMLKTLLNPEVGFIIVAFDKRQQEIKTMNYIGTEARCVNIDVLRRCAESLETSNKIKEHVKQQP